MAGDGVAVQDERLAALLRDLVLNSDGVAHIEDHGHLILGGGDGVEHLLALQADEVVGVAVQHGGAELGDDAAGLGLRPFLRRGDALAAQQLDILLLFFDV